MVSLKSVPLPRFVFGPVLLAHLALFFVCAGVGFAEDRLIALQQQLPTRRSTACLNPIEVLKERQLSSRQLNSLPRSAANAGIGVPFAGVFKVYPQAGILRVRVPHRMRMPERAGDGAVRLYFRPADGVALKASEATNLVVQASDDFALWTTLSTNGNGLVLTNG